MGTFENKSTLRSQPLTFNDSARRLLNEITDATTQLGVKDLDVTYVHGAGTLYSNIGNLTTLYPGQFYSTSNVSPSSPQLTEQLQGVVGTTTEATTSWIPNRTQITVEYSSSLVGLSFLWLSLGLFGILSNALFVLMTSSGSVRRESYAVYLLVLAAISIIFMIAQLIISLATLIFHFSNINIRYAQQE